MIQAQPVDASLDLLAERTVAALQSVEYAQKPVRHHRVHLPAGEAEAIEAPMILNAPGGRTTQTSAVEYLMIVDDDIYVVTMGTSPDRSEAYAPVFDQIMQCFQLLE